jgi:D-tyrosyl-tRNA(Tyr) deacylase
MICVVQRVSSASVKIEKPAYNATISVGLCVLLGIEEGDGEKQAAWMARKLANLRIFHDEKSKMNRSVTDVEGEILLISQFTLAGDCRAGNRPSFISAAHPDVAERLVDLVCTLLQHEHGISVSTGVFGAMMQLTIINEGPVTLILQRD